MNKIREKLNNFMIGRYGQDDFSKFLLIVAFIFLLLSLFFKNAGRSILDFLTLAALAYSYYRIFSRNFNKRSRENNWYLKKKKSVINWFNTNKQRWIQRKEYKFFRCPSCHCMLRVPRGKGKIQVTCRKCGNRFEGKS